VVQPMNYALLPYIGAGTFADPYRPRVEAGQWWRAIDLRPDSTRTDGYAIVATRERLRDGFYLGDAPDETTRAVKRLLASRLGVSLRPSRLRQIIPALLIAAPMTRTRRMWKAIRPATTGWEIYLGRLFWRMPVIAFGTTLTENFNTSNGTTLGPTLTWTEVVGDWAIDSNNAILNTTATSASARAESDLATSDHYAQVVVVDLDSPSDGTAIVGGACARFAAAAETYYTGQLYKFPPGSDSARTQKVVAGSLTTIGSETAITFAANDTVKIECNGSSIKRYYNGSLQDTATDSAITGNVRCGLFGFSSGAANFPRLDSFEAADLGGGGDALPGASVGCM
jgi:hypothetical protein